MIVSQQVQQDMSWSNTYGHHCVQWIWGSRVGLSYLKHSTCHTFPMASSTASPSGRNLPSQLQHLSEEQGRWVEPGRGIRTGVQLLVVNECLTMLINTQHSSPFELTEYFTLPSEHLESQLKYQDSSPEPFAQPHWQQPPCLLSSIESWINWVQHNCMPVCNSVSQTVQHGTTAANHKHDRPCLIQRQQYGKWSKEIRFYPSSTNWVLECWGNMSQPRVQYNSCCTRCSLSDSNVIS